MLRLREMEVTTQRAAREDGLADLNAVGPHWILRRQHAREKAAAFEGAAARSGQRNLWEKFRFGYANIRVCCYQYLFGFADVRPALEHSGPMRGLTVVTAESGTFCPMLLRT